MNQAADDPRDNKRRRAREQEISRARAAKARAEAERKRRNNIVLAVTAGVVVVAIVVVLIVVKSSGGSKGTDLANIPPPPVSQNLASVSAINSLASIPVGSLVASMNSGVTLSAPKAINGNPPPGQSATKPMFLYIGAEYCPYCAAERWVMLTALSKFGTFANVGQTTSSASDVDPSTPTLSFHGATYTSQYIDFSSVEETTNVPQGSGYQPLETPTPAQQAFLTQNDSSGGIPFINIAGKFSAGVQYDPATLKGLSWDQVAAQALDGSTTVGKTIQGAAGQMVSAICQVTNQQPSAVCAAFSTTTSH